MLQGEKDKPCESLRCAGWTISAKHGPNPIHRELPDGRCSPSPARARESSFPSARASDLHNLCTNLRSRRKEGLEEMVAVFFVMCLMWLPSMLEFCMCVCICVT